MNHFSLSVNDVTAFIAVSSFPFDFAQGGEPVEPWIKPGMTGRKGEL
jgi:hypothetical protein